jgi:hypothetical protein
MAQVVFRDNKSMFFLKPAFRHCVLIGGLVVNEVVWLEKKRYRIGRGAKRRALENFVCVEVDIKGDFKGLTCVSAVKRAIGLKDWRVITPHQLYRRIKQW